MTSATPQVHNINELYLAVVVNLIATLLKFGDRTQIGAVHLATSLVADIQLISAASVWVYATQVAAEGLTRASMSSVVSLSGGALLANVVSVTLLVDRDGLVPPALSQPMANLLLFIARPWARRHTEPVRRRVVDVPTEAASTDAIFLVLRRLRVPMVVLVLIFAVSVAGLSLIPAQDAEGNPAPMSVFDAFYFMSYTATTIGFGELPNTFTTTQRMWVTLSIYASVIGWAFAIGTLFALIQDQSFREAVRIQQMRRKVRRIDEPFLIVAGYGQAGRQVCRSLDDARRRFVVIDDIRARIEALATEQFTVDIPAIDADVRSPAVLGLAGLGHRHCEGVLALTDDDETNLAVVMTVKLLRPEVPVIARCSDRAVEEQMHDFGADAVINPNDRYGGYLLLALQRPVTYQLVTWLMSPAGTPLPEAREGLRGGRWVVCADGQFGTEVADDLRSGCAGRDRGRPARRQPGRHRGGRAGRRHRTRHHQPGPRRARSPGQPVDLPVRAAEDEHQRRAGAGPGHRLGLRRDRPGGTREPGSGRDAGVLELRRPRPQPGRRLVKGVAGGDRRALRRRRARASAGAADHGGVALRCPLAAQSRADAGGPAAPSGRPQPSVAGVPVAVAARRAAGLRAVARRTAARR